MLRKLWARMFRTRRPFKLTKPGWIFILYTIGVGAGAINTGNNLLYLVFGVFLGLLLASGFLSDLSLWGVDVDATFPHATRAGEPVSLFLTATNTKSRVPSISALVTLEGALRGAPVELKRHVPFIRARGVENARIEWTPPARGRYRLDHVRLSTKFPFSLLEKWWRLRVDESAPRGFFVTPATRPIDFRRLPLRLDGEDKSAENPDRGEGSTLLGVHEFVPGDNPRRIHWKSSAKRAAALGDEGAWLVRDMSRDERDEIVFVCPEPARLARLSDADVESRVAFLASALDACRNGGYAARVVANGRSVADEAAFLALWDPRKPMGADMDEFIGGPVPPSNPASKWVDVEEAYAARDAA